MSVRPPLAEKALSESYGRLRYRNTSLLVWQQQQQQLERLLPDTYLRRSRSAWYSQYGNAAVLVRDRRGLRQAGGAPRDDHDARSAFCALM